MTPSRATRDRQLRVGRRTAVTVSRLASYVMVRLLTNGPLMKRSRGLMDMQQAGKRKDLGNLPGSRRISIGEFGTDPVYITPS